MFIMKLFSDPRTFAALTLIVVFSVCLHEYLHAWVALKLGDPTAARLGHLTMNPFKQMGIISIVMLIFIGLAWGQVPVDPQNLDSKFKRIAVSLAGVAGNLLLAVTFSILAFLTFLYLPQKEFAIEMLKNAAVINMVLLCINIMPVPGLDGFNVVREFIKINSQKAAEAANVFFFILTMVLFFNIDKITGFVSRQVTLFLEFLRKLYTGA